MYSERLPPQIVRGGYEKDDVDEINRILNFVSKPCPHDFPKELKHLWKNNLEFSLTPYQSGWMQLFEKHTKKTHNPRKYTTYLENKKKY